ncbi:GntR family transcriptional regulator [Ruminococcus sp.]|uniref:GntR family transcriptional regulator n=1 Tax=Ruminococcus sp. TaxID=41978 RepID=UPI0025CE13D5|nr:GntR family transcriptional regulator [Ruminococcus sp.]
MEIQKNSPVPIYMQIVYDIQNKINFGKLRSGDQLPSVRSISKECDINVNTVLKAYDQLIKEGYVTSQKGLGYYVSSNIKENVAAYQMEYIRQSLELIKTSAEIGDISLETVCNLLNEVWNEGE